VGARETGNHTRRQAGGPEEPQLWRPAKPPLHRTTPTHGHSAAHGRDAACLPSPPTGVKCYERHKRGAWHGQGTAPRPGTFAANPTPSPLSPPPFENNAGRQPPRARWGTYRVECARARPPHLCWSTANTRKATQRDGEWTRKGGRWRASPASRQGQHESPHHVEGGDFR
jgi:hypothetical protein